MERRERKNKGLGLLGGLGILGGVAAVGYGVYKLMEEIDKQSQERVRNEPPRNHQPYHHEQPHELPYFDDFDQVNNHAEDDYSEDLYDSTIDEYNCPISMTMMRDPYIITRCGHTFEKRNIVEYLNKKGRCPLCRKRASRSDLIPNFTLKGLLEKRKNEIKKE